MTVRLYLSGPMTSQPEFNRPAFMDAEARLTEAGFLVLNPARNVPLADSPTWQDWMRLAVAQLATADMVALLPGWHYSHGARTEKMLAEALGLPVRRLHELEET